MPEELRRVVYVVIDGMSTEAFEQVTASGRAPALSFLKDNARYVRDSVAVFPTITPAATASLVTGELPARHGIPGMCWYDRDAQRFVNYGQSPRAAVVEGLAQVVEDIVVNLNCKHLSADVRTVHERLHELGLSSASINFMVFRGPFMHETRPNILGRWFFKEQLAGELPGPKEHYFADVVNGDSAGCADRLSGHGLDNKIRVTDGWAACVTRDLLERGAADMILFYLHENDHRSHRGGPQSQIESLADADQHIGEVLGSFGSWEQTLERVGFVVTADHSQTPIDDDDEHVLDLSEILGDFERVEPGKGAEPLGHRDLACAGNGRVGFVYLNPDRRSDLLGPVVDALSAASGIDQIMWRDGDDYRVASRRGRLRFRTADGDGVVDQRGNKWSFSGDLEAVDGVVEGNEIRTSEYPLAMWRIKGALDLDRIGDVVVTTRLTYGFCDLSGAHHRGGGDHASLHVQDSRVPFLSTLQDPPLHPSTIDVVPHIVDHFCRARSG